MVWRGRYPDIFYSFARRWLTAEVELAKGTYQGITRAWRTVLKWGYRVGMEISSFTLRRGNGRSDEARRLPAPPVQNLSNRIHGGNQYL
jgi:hypothetical protein